MNARDVPRSQGEWIRRPAQSLQRVETWVMDRNGRLKPHAEPVLQRAKIVIGLLTASAPSRRPDSNFLVEQACGIRRCAAQEAARRIANLPYISFGANTSAFWPGWPDRVVISITQTCKKGAIFRVVGEPVRYICQQIRWIPAVVVGETNDVAFRHGQSNITPPRKTMGRSKVTDGEV